MDEIKELLIQTIEHARTTGRAVTIEPPATYAAITGLESRCGALPANIRELVEYAAGFSVEDFVVAFVNDYQFEFEGMFPCVIPIAADGAGNFWVVDVGSDGSWRSIFFVAHDPPVAILQARDIGAFIAQVFEARTSGPLLETAIDRIWNTDPYTMSRAQALTASDPVLRLFAERLDDSFVVVDLRTGHEGSGFVWGSAGPNTEVRRAEHELLFAVEQKKRGLLARLFSR